MSETQPGHYADNYNTFEKFVQHFTLEDAQSVNAEPGMNTAYGNKCLELLLCATCRPGTRTFLFQLITDEATHNYMNWNQVLGIKEQFTRVYPCLTS